jgi:adenylate cyclase, class 2
MPIEAELKTTLDDPEHVRHHLAQHGSPTSSTYHDTYYDYPDQSLTTRGEELRIRTVTTLDQTQHLLTYKAPPVHHGSGSKPEHETQIADPQPIDTALRALGLHPFINLIKHCQNTLLTHAGHSMLATIVTVPELEKTFLEVETIVQDPHNVESALIAITALLSTLDITPDHLTTEPYTEAVTRARDT